MTTDEQLEDEWNPDEAVTEYDHDRVDDELGPTPADFRSALEDAESPDPVEGQTPVETT